MLKENRYAKVTFISGLVIIPLVWKMITSFHYEGLAAIEGFIWLLSVSFFVLLGLCSGIAALIKEKKTAKDKKNSIYSFLFLFVVCSVSLILWINL